MIKNVAFAALETMSLLNNIHQDNIKDSFVFYCWCFSKFNKWIIFMEEKSVDVRSIFCDTICLACVVCTEDVTLQAIWVSAFTITLHCYNVLWHTFLM